MKIKNVSTNTIKIFTITGNFKKQTNFDPEILKNKFLVYWFYVFYMEAKLDPQTSK